MSHSPNDHYAPSRPTMAPSHDPYADSAPAWTLDRQTTTQTSNNGPDHFPGTEFVDVGRVFQGPGYHGELPRTEPIATVAIILAILSVFPWVGLVAIVVGVAALLVLRNNPYRGGRGLAVSAITIGALSSLAWFTFRVLGSFLSGF